MERTCKLAAAAVVLHVAAGLVSLLVLAGGTPALEPSAQRRAAYLAEHTGAWRAAWAVWGLAGISFVALMVHLSPTRAVWILSVLSVAADLASQAVLAWVVPGAAPETQSTWEPRGWTGAAVVANLGYTLTGVVAVVHAAAAGRITRATAWLSLPVWLAGVGVALCHLVGWDAGLVVASAFLTAAVTAWIAWIGGHACRS